MNKKSFFDWVKKNRVYINGVIILIVVYLLYRRFLVSRPVKPRGSLDNEVEKRDVSKAKITKEQAQTKAEQLFKAMNYIGGTDEVTIFSILKGLSEDDYNLIYNEFGIRYYSTIFGESTFSMLGNPFDLNMWLVNELTEPELRDLKRLNPNLPI